MRAVVVRGVPPGAPTSRQRRYIGSAGLQAGGGDPFKDEPSSGDTCAAARAPLGLERQASTGLTGLLANVEVDRTRGHPEQEEGSRRIPKSATG